jgi:pullulanase
MKNDTIFADASACGNETASQRAMMRKFMIESVLYWVKEFHIDGFRFDLMAIHDIETMNQISKALRTVKPDILLYGEGWAAGSPNMPQEKLAFKRYVGKLDSIAVFSDDIRDGIKGYVFESKAKGFVNGNPALTETVKFGIVGVMSHPQVNMQKAFWDKVPYASAPGQVINYADCHDNLALWDKLSVSAPEATIEERIQMQEIAMGIVLTSQGIPFFLAGSEFLRTKKGVENSFNSPDSINAIDWTLKAKNLKVFKFVKQLIQIRKTHPLFRLQTADAIGEQLSFMELPEGLIGYTIQRKNEKDLWKTAMVVCNSLGSKQEITLPAGTWKVALSNTNPPTIDAGKLTVEKLTLAILYQN